MHLPATTTTEKENENEKQRQNVRRYYNDIKDPNTKRLKTMKVNSINQIVFELNSC